MSEETLKDKTAKGLFWGGISNGLQQILSLLFGVLLLRILTPDDYGMVGMLAIFTGIASSMQESGFTTALINKKKFEHDDYNAVFWFNILTGILIYVILFFAAPIIAWYFEIPALTNLSRLLFLSFLFGGIGIAHNAILVKKLMIKERAKIDIIALLGSGIIGIALALNGFSYWGLAIQAVAYITISSLLKWHFSPWKPTLRLNLTPLKGMFGFSIKLFLTNIFWQINSNIFSVLLGKLYNPAQVGFYSQGYKWMTMGSSFILGMVNGVAQPVLVEMTEDKERQRNAFRKMLRFGAFISFPLILGLAFVSKEFLFIAGGGEKWLPSVPFLQLFCIWGSASYIWALYSNLLMTHGKSNIYMWGIFLVGTQQVISVYIMLPYGIKPMLVAYIVSFFIGLLFWNYFVNKLIGIRLMDVFKDILPYLISAIGSFSITYYITSSIQSVYILLCAKIMISVTLYILIMRYSNSVIFKESSNFFLDKFK